MKKCLFCAEEIQDAAIKCRHCGSMLGDPPELPTSQPGVPGGSVQPDAFEDGRGLAHRGDAIDSIEPSPKHRGAALVAVIVGFLMTFSAATVGVAVFVMWFGLAFALSGSWIVRWLGGVLLAIVLAVVGTAVSGRGPTATEPFAASAIDRQAQTPTSSDTRPTAATQSVPEAGLTAPQRNAVRSAQNYLNVSGFSRRGLIDQLSSEYGSKFSIGDATAAVESLTIDWNQQAARSAATYMEVSGFSCQGLIEQLSSEHGSKYTVEQAAYGAKQAGAC